MGKKEESGSEDPKMDRKKFLEIMGKGMGVQSEEEPKPRKKSL